MIRTPCGQASRLLFAAFCVILSGALPALCQSSIQGIVLDPTGASVPEASITAVLDATGMTRTARTRADGRYRLPGLPIGTYTLRCEKAGFQNAVVQSVSLSIGQVLEQTIQLKLAVADNRIDVHEQADALGTTDTTSSVALGREPLEETPSQNRSYLGIVLLAPGVAPSAGSNALRTKAGIRSAAPDSGFTFAGMRPRNNSLSIDGLDNRDETTGGSRVAVGQEAVQEFRVGASNIEPEFGGGSGGNLNVVTLSGTNRFHGDVNLFAGDSFIEARPPEVDDAAVPHRRQYQPEAALNGPLSRDRTFFASTIELERESSEEFSEVPGSGNVARINAALTRPEFQRSAVRNIAGGLFPSASASTQFSFKLTHRLNATNELMARYALSRAHISSEVLGSDNFSERSARGSSRNQDASYAAGWQAVRGAHFVSELRFQFGRRTVDLTPNSHGALIEIPGVVSFGQSAQLDANRTEDHLQAVEAVTLVRGRHQLGLGGSVQRVHLDSRMADHFAGVFVFPTLAAFDRGMPDIFLQAFGDPHTQYAVTPAALWAQDQWQPMGGLTIVAGMRYEAERLPKPFASASTNVAPRLGLAWQPGGRGPYVLRAGFGIFHDRYPLAFLNNAVQKDGIHAFEQYAVGADAVRAFATGRGGTLAAPLAGIPLAIYAPDARFPSAYARKLTAGVERSLDPNTTLAVDYIDVRGYHLPRIRNAALVLPPLYRLEQAARSSYQGVTVTVRRRFVNELTYLIAYTGGKAYDDASDYDEQPQNPADTRLEWARSRQYQAHRLVASGIFELPFDALHGAPDWLRSIGERFDLAPVLSIGSPRPLNAVETTDVYRTGAYPISARPPGIARNAFYVRGQFSLDLRATKAFEFWKEHGLFLFGLGIYNLTNHSNPLRVSSFYSAPDRLLSTYRGIIESLNARQVQFSFQWEF